MKGAGRALGHGPLHAVRNRLALGLHGELVTIDRQVDGLRVDPGQVEGDDELVTLPVRVHRHDGRSQRGAEQLPGQPVKLLERVGAHQHVHVPPPRLES
jgi:hypothetical protein